MRLRRRQLAEEKAAKTAVKIMIPLILFIFPGVFVVLVGPAGIQMAAMMSDKVIAGRRRHRASTRDRLTTSIPNPPRRRLRHGQEPDPTSPRPPARPATVEAAADRRRSSSSSRWSPPCSWKPCRSAMPSGARSWARPPRCGHRSWTRSAIGSKTSGRISGSGSLPISERVPWDPKLVLPLIAVVMAIAMLMLRL